MATRIDETTWPARLALMVGQQVRHYRERPEWRVSAQTLADRTRDLGHELKRSVIANLESGRRDYVTLADIFVLAQALDVPPIALMVPLQDGTRLEVGDGEFADGWAVVEWINGDSSWVGRRDQPWQADARGWYDATEPYLLKAELDKAVSWMLNARLEALDAAKVSPEAATLAQRLAIAERRHAQSLLSQLRDLGVEVPKYLGAASLLDE